MALPRGLKRFGIAFALALVVIGAIYAAQDILYAQADLAGAERWYEPACKIPIPGPNLEVSREIASLARRSSPLLRENALAAAIQAAARAEYGSAERFNALYQSAMLAILSGDFPRAEAKLRAAIDAAPTWCRPRMVLASVLWATGRRENAEHEATLALRCAGRMEPDVKRTLNEARAQATATESRRPR